MRAFLIDFENVKSAGLVGIETLGMEDQVVILYSQNSNTLSFEMHQKILSCEANVEYYQIRRGGKNSLDFQLSTLLGYLLASGLYTHLYIISNDSGFDALYDFWSSQYIPTDCVVYRRPNIANAVAHSALNGLPVKALEPEEDPGEVDVAVGDSAAYDQFTIEEVLPEPEAEEPVSEEAPDAAQQAPQPPQEAEGPALSDEETAAVFAALRAVQEEEEPREETRPEPAGIPMLEGTPAMDDGGELDGPSAAARMKQAEMEAEEEAAFSPLLFSAESFPPAAEPDTSPDAAREEAEESRPRRRRGHTRREKEPAQPENGGAKKADPSQLAALITRLEPELSDICNREQRAAVAEAILSSEGKQEFYRGIIRRFGQKKGLQVYKAVKSDFAAFKKK